MAGPVSRQLPSLPSAVQRMPSLGPGNGAPQQRKSYEELKKSVHAKLVDKLDASKLDIQNLEAAKRQLRPVIEVLLQQEASLLTKMDMERLIDEVIAEVLGLGPLETLLRDATISEIMVNGPKAIWVERRGKIEKTDVEFRDNTHLLQIIDRIVSKVGRRVDETSPICDARLVDGSRVNVIIPPLALDGAAMSIRRFGSKPLKLQDLLNFKAFTPEMAMLFEGAIKAPLNIIISGGTGSGKTTLLNTLSSFIPGDERILTIEDAAELQLQQDHVVRLETRPPNIEGKGAIPARELVKNALRMRPDRVIVGECRGPETLDMLQAMNTGHEGSMTTLHANTPRDAVARVETMVAMGGIELPVKALRHQFCSAVDMIIQVNRLQGGPRKVTSVTEVLHLEQETVIMQEVFRYRQLGIDQNGRAFGQFEATGVRPAFMPRLEAAGIRLPPNLFAERVLMRD